MRSYLHRERPNMPTPVTRKMKPFAETFAYCLLNSAQGENGTAIIRQQPARPVPLEIPPQINNVNVMVGEHPQMQQPNREMGLGVVGAYGRSYFISYY